MKPFLLLTLLFAPVPAFADTVFDRMIGTWRGSGSYSEGGPTVDLRCRITISGTSDAIDLAGRCASSLGGDDFTMGVERGPGSTARVDTGGGSRASDSSITGLSGPLGSNGLVVKGTAGSEETTVQLLLNDDGSLVFATREVTPAKTSVSYVTLLRQ